jgi:hypothetical protein
MGAFDGFIYKQLKIAHGAKRARELTPYVDIAVQAVLMVVSFGSIGFTAMSSIGSLESFAGKAISKINKILGDGIIGSMLKAACNDPATALRISSRFVELIQATGMVANAGYTGLKADYEQESGNFHATVVKTQADFEKIEQREHISRELMIRNIKRITEEVGAVAKVLDSEYQTIKFLNVKSKIG